MKFHRIIPTLFFLLLLISALVVSTGELKTLEAFDLELTNTFNQSSPVAFPSGTIVNVPPGALVKGKLFHFEITELILEKSDDGQTVDQTFRFDNIPAFGFPEAGNYDLQQALPSKFIFGIPIRAAACFYRFELRFMAKMYLDNSGFGDLAPFLLNGVVEFTGSIADPNFNPFPAGVLFCCVNFCLETLEINIDVKQAGTIVHNLNLNEPIPPTVEIILNAAEAGGFTLPETAAVDVTISIVLRGTITEQITNACITQGGYGLNDPPLDATGEAPAAPPRFNRLLRQQLPEDLDLDRLDVLKTWAGDVQWFNQDGAIPGANTDQLSAELLESLDEVFAEVTFNEGPKTGQTEQTEKVVIPNSPPSVASVQIVSDTDPPMTTSTLRAIPQGFTDPDGDPESYIFRWFNQNSIIRGAGTDTLGSRNFKKGDSIFVVAIPFDGKFPGKGVNAVIGIQNAPPQFSVLDLQVEPLPARERSVLAALPDGWDDPDGDPERYEFQWHNQSGPLKGTLAFPDTQQERIRSVLPVELSLPIPLFAGLKLTVPLAAAQAGTVQFTSPSGKVITQEIPEVEDPNASGNLTVVLDEVGEYTVREDFKLIVRSTNPLLPINGSGGRTFTWRYTNTEPGELAYSFSTQVRNLSVNVTGSAEANVNIANPGKEITVQFTVTKAISPGTKFTADVDYQADFTKSSAVTATGVLVTGKELTGENFKAGDEVFVVVTATDGQANGNSLESERILILNSPPTLRRVQVRANSKPITSQSVLTATATGFTDIDGDKQQILYQWHNQNGPIAGATDPTLTGAFSAGDQVFVEATPFDGTDRGAAVQSGVFIITEPWDVNGDNKVNVFDLVIVGNNFGKPQPDPVADVNGDGAVNIFDLVIIAGHFGETFGEVAAAAPAANRSTD